jgi:hypothetical protein
VRRFTLLGILFFGHVGGWSETEVFSATMITMSTSVKLHPPTIEERKRLDEDLALMEEKLQGIIVLMRDSYGKNSQAAIRADEIAGAIQRLKWELERVQQKTRAANA